MRDVVLRLVGGIIGIILGGIIIISIINLIFRGKYRKGD